MTDQLAIKLKSVVHNFYVGVLLSWALVLVFMPPMQVFALDTPKTDVTMPDNQQNPGPNDDGVSNPEQPTNDENDNPTADLVAIISAFATEHTTTDPLVVKGSLNYLPEGSNARVLLHNSDGAEISKSDTVAIGSDIELAKLTLPTDIKNGSYAVKLDVFNKNAEPETIIRTVEENVVINIAPVVVEGSVVAPETTNPEPELNAIQQTDTQNQYEELKIDLPPIETIKTISSVKKSSINTVANLGVATSGSVYGLSEAIVTGKSGSTEGILPASPDGNIDNDKPIQSIKLKSDNIKEDLAIQPSKDGWRIFGQPWYFWCTGVGVVYGIWIGARRFLQRDV